MRNTPNTARAASWTLASMTRSRIACDCGVSVARRADEGDALVSDG
jgi:hypothetical protein